MRQLLAVVLLISLPALTMAQDEDTRRFGLRYNKDLYSQETPKKTLSALFRAFERDRYDYLVAQLLDPAFVDEQLKLSYPIYEKAAREQVVKEGLERRGFDPIFIRQRVRDLANQANFEYLVRRIRAKLDNDPEALKEMKRLASEGTIDEGADGTTVKHKDVKDHTLFLRKIGERWFVENKIQE
jgi:hypothetical protein